MAEMFFQGWSGIVRVLVVGALAYIGLVATLRVAGKRTLSKMNAFDLVVTVALGSTLATVMLSKDIALAEGLVAFGLLAGLQFMVSWLSVRSQAVRDLVTSEPTLLFYNGAFLPAALRSERVTEAEARAAVRGQGHGTLAEIAAIVLENDGSLTVIPRAAISAPSALTGVRGMPDVS